MTPSSSFLIIPVLGIATGIYYAKIGFTPLISGTLLILTLLLYTLIKNLSKNPIIAYKFNKSHYTWIFLLFVAIGIVDYDFSRCDIAPEIINRSLYAEGIVEDIHNSNYGDKCILRVLNLIDSTYSKRPTSNFKILINSDILSSKIGDYIQVPFHGDKIKDNPNSFHEGYSQRLSDKGILYTSKITNEDLILLGHQHSIKEVSCNMRGELEALIEKSGLSTDTSHFLITILLGDREYLNNHQNLLFSDAGISHILALSGMHVGILSSIVLWLLLPLNLFKCYKLRLILTVAILFLYSFITGCAPSTTRAVLMISAVTISVVLQRKSNAWNALLFATLIILLLTPRALFDPGFQLSFLCVASLIFLGSTLNPVGLRHHPVLFRVSEGIIASTVATLGTWSLAAYYFKQFPILFLPVNLLILPLLPVFIFVSLNYIILHSIGINSEILAYSLDYTYQSFTKFLSWITRQGTSALHINPSIESVLCWIVFMFLLFYWVNSKRNALLTYSTVGTLIISISLLIFSSNPIKDGILITQDTSSLKIICRERSNEKVLHIPVGTNSELQFHQDTLLILDGNLNNLPPKTFKKTYKAVIIGSKTEGDLITALSRLNSNMYITHPKLRKKQESKILDILDSLCYESYSIRYNGPWKLVYDR